jgi:hypothetical protein
VDSSRIAAPTAGEPEAPMLAAIQDFFRSHVMDETGRRARINLFWCE